MTSVWDWLFIASAFLVLYPYLLYPLGVFLRARARRKPLATLPLQEGLTASIVVAAYNEEAQVSRRLEELCGLARKASVPTDVIVVSDGSTDQTVANARRVAGVRVVALEQNAGKAVALNTGVSESTGDIVVFGDMRQRWAPDALQNLLLPFGDPAVGAVSGELVLAAGSGATEGVGLYWRFEKWLREAESSFSSVVGVTGSIAAVRRSLYRPLPAGTILDDVYWPIRVAMAGGRVVYDRRAQAFDALPAAAGDEFGRKVRTLAGNLQLARLLPSAVVPWRNPIWLQFVSHKLARLAAPWALVGLVLASACRSGVPFFRLALLLQVMFYAAGVLALWRRWRWPPLSAAGSFLLLNAAAWVAFWVWVTGTERRAWRKVQYAGAGHAAQTEPSKPTTGGGV